MEDIKIIRGNHSYNTKWSFLRILICCDRNGFCFYDVTINKEKSIILFLFSMILMFAEVFLANKYGSVGERDYCVFLVPSVFFMFSFVKQIRLQDNKIYKMLRVMSSLMFYTHLWVEFCINKVIAFFEMNTHNSCIPLLLVTAATLILSYAIFVLSNKEKFRWLKNLYTYPGSDFRNGKASEEDGRAELCVHFSKDQAKIQRRSGIRELIYGYADSDIQSQIYEKITNHECGQNSRSARGRSELSAMTTEEKHALFQYSNPCI